MVDEVVGRGFAGTGTVELGSVKTLLGLMGEAGGDAGAGGEAAGEGLGGRTA